MCRLFLLNEKILLWLVMYEVPSHPLSRLHLLKIPIPLKSSKLRNKPLAHGLGEIPIYLNCGTVYISRLLVAVTVPDQMRWSTATKTELSSRHAESSFVTCLLHFLPLYLTSLLLSVSTAPYRVRNKRLSQ